MKLRNLINVLLTIFLFTGCNNYENKEFYELKVGEELEIYYSTNSCCHYCLVNENKLKNLKLIDEKVVVATPSNCDGCNHTAAFVFEALSVGVDTVYLKQIVGGDDCDSSSTFEAEVYIVNIK